MSTPSGFDAITSVVIVSKLFVQLNFSACSFCKVAIEQDCKSSNTIANSINLSGRCSDVASVESWLWWCSFDDGLCLWD